jgi:hypothetical protein
MSTTPHSSQKDMFAPPTVLGQKLVLEIKGIAIEPSKMRLKERKTIAPPNYHIPSFKNSKRWVTKLPNGRPMNRPLLISSPEFQVWKEKVIQSLCSQLLCGCQTGSDETPQVRSKLFAILSQLPADDSVNDLTSGSWKVEIVPPGQEGALIEITRLR